MEKNKVMLVDGMALLFRAFYATAMSNYYMINSKGIPTNAIYGFVKHLSTAIKTYSPTHVICCWDMGSTTFRTELFPAYKANRGEPPVELIPQFDLVKEVVDALNIPNIGQKGFEADDCIGTLTRHFNDDSEVLILTGDQDILQLLQKNVTVVLLQKGYGNYAEYTADRFQAEKGLSPQQMIDLKALMGDSSDNYPGVKGIGEKTASSLLKRFETIDGILNNLSELTPSQRKKIEQDREVLDLCRQLATINCHVEISCTLDDARLTINEQKMLAKFQELEFKNPDHLTV